MLVLAGRRLARATEAGGAALAADDSERLLPLPLGAAPSLGGGGVAVAVLPVVVAPLLSPADSLFSGPRVNGGGGGET